MWGEAIPAIKKAERVSKKQSDWDSSLCIRNQESNISSGTCEKGVCVCMHVHACVFTYVCMHVYMCTYIYVCMHVHECTCIYALFVCMCVCVYMTYFVSLLRMSDWEQNVQKICFLVETGKMFGKNMHFSVKLLNWPPRSKLLVRPEMCLDTSPHSRRLRAHGKETMSLVYSAGIC